MDLGSRVRVPYPGWDTAQVVENAADAVKRDPDRYDGLRGVDLTHYWVVQGDASKVLWIHEMHLTPLEDPCTP